MPPSTPSPATLAAVAARLSSSPFRTSAAARVAPRRLLATSPALRARVGNAPRTSPAAAPSADGELGVGELEGANLRIEPIRRVGEDDRTMRARLVYQSRKRGTLESDLLMSTFADAHLPTMTRDQMAAYDRFLDENDWDIYYWATQDVPSPVAPKQQQPTTPDAQSSSSPTYAGGSEAAIAAEEAAAKEAAGEDQPVSPSPQAVAAVAAAAAASSEPYRRPGEGEWAQTVGTFRPAYRPVPARWRDSEILRLLRLHVRSRSADTSSAVEPEEQGQSGDKKDDGVSGKGMGFMPELRS